jgi:nicotinate phosphoribosyltransferase
VGKDRTPARLPDLRIADFGTRRRHSFLWQDWAVQAMQEGLGEAFTGTSNCLIAKNRDLEAIGTNAHELPMVYAALAETDEDLARAPYDVLSTGTRSIPATCASSCPTPTARAASSKRARLADGLDRHPHRFRRPGAGGGDRHRLVEIPRRGPREKLVIFSDGLDVDKIEELCTEFSGRVRVSFGWGTLLTNDFRGLVEDDALAPFSLVCKAVAANGRPTVKLSDNPEKAMGPEAEIARYKRVFGVGEQERLEVVV